MAEVKLKSIALLTAGIFVLLFLHFVPVGLGNVTVVGKSNPGTAAEGIEKNPAIVPATNQDGFALKVKQANSGSVIASSVDTFLYVVRAQPSYVKN